jgi:hypothetical protein
MSQTVPDAMALFANGCAAGGVRGSSPGGYESAASAFW